MGLLAVALAPVIAILVYFYVRDRYEKEPKSMLLKAFLVGMATTILAIIIESSMAKYWPYPEEGSMLSLFLFALLGIALIEEGVKFLPLTTMFYPHSEMNEIYDGIIYGVFISLGFAAVENVLYVFHHGYMVGVKRAFMAVPGHAVYGAIMGFFVGLAKFSDEGKTLLILKGLFYAVLAHALYDFFLFANLGWLSLLLAVGVVIYGWKYVNRKIVYANDNSPFREIAEETEESGETPSV